MGFRYLDPEKYKELAEQIQEKRCDREEQIETIKETLITLLANNNIKAEISGRPKHIYSIYRKMTQKVMPFDAASPVLQIDGGRPSPASAKSVSEIDTGRLDAVVPEHVAAPAEQGAQSAQSFLCREVVLDGDQGVAGYEFQLRRGAGGRLLARSRRVQHLQNEVLVRNLVQHAVHKMLGQRVTFVPVLDSFAASPVLRQMPPHGVVIVLQQGTGEKPDGTELLDQVRELRQAGFCVALEECFDAPYFGQLAPTVDYFVVDGAALNPVSLRMLMAGLAKINPEATTVAKGVVVFEFMA